MKKTKLYLILIFLLNSFFCTPLFAQDIPSAENIGQIEKSEDEWKKLLSPEAFYVCRQQGTERAFTGGYYNSKKSGIYACVACNLALFSSDHKFDSGTGWPSFYRPYKELYIKTIKDISHGMQRTEVRCMRCDAHLGHVFTDGPNPTGLRYCINSVALKFYP